MKYIPLTQGLSAIVDDDLFPELNIHKWCAHKEKRTYYALRGISINNKTKIIRMHHLVLPGVEMVDHINGNGLDNRRENLRPATGTQNNANRSKRFNVTSRYKGVSWDKSRNKWIAQLSNNRQKVLHRRFNSEIEAAKAYNKAAIENFGEYAKLNVIEGA